MTEKRKFVTVKIIIKGQIEAGIDYGIIGDGYMKEMEMLEKVETQNFARMNMTKAQKNYQKAQLAN